jgi:hypothetical protein
VANLVVKKPASTTGGKMFEFTKHAEELGLLAGKTEHSWEVWIQGPEETVDSGYEVVFAATNNNQHDRLNFRANLNLSRSEKTQKRFDKALRRLFGIPDSLSFSSAVVLIILIPKYKRVVLTVQKMEWK